MFQAILRNHSTTNNSTGTDKNTSHAYGPLYEELLAPYRESAKSVLEIGVYSGASVHVLAEYFSNARVYGIDICPERILPKYKTNPRVTFAHIDGTQPSAPVLLGNVKYDVVIEDASHVPDDQIASLDVFAPYMADGGMYVIEDINERVVDYVRPRLQEVSDRHGLKMVWYDLRHVKNQFDDIVAVFYRQ